MRRDLTAMAGFDLALDEETGELVFPATARPSSTSARSRVDLLPVLADPAADGPDPAYRMYRDVGNEAERAAAARLGLRYDLTVLAAGLYGREFVKTFGHDHPERPGTGVTYPELYQVLAGEAVFVLERRNAPPQQGFASVSLVSAGPGDALVIPPGAAHVTVNLGRGQLVLANWVARSFESDYGRVRAEGGAAVRVVSDGQGGWRWEPNPRAGAVGRVVVREARTVAEAAGLGPALRQPIRRLLVEDPGRLAWLARPEAHLAFLSACRRALEGAAEA